MPAPPETKLMHYPNSLPLGRRGVIIGESSPSPRPRLRAPRGSVSCPQAIVDPAELRRFATNLKRFNADLQSSLAGLHGQLIGLGDSWRDQEHEKFAQAFEQTMQVVNRFVEAANQHIPFLVRKAERIEEYLQQK